MKLTTAASFQCVTALAEAMELLSKEKHPS
jgi:hypothetical protein